MSERLKTLQGIEATTNLWKYGGSYPIASMAMVIIGGMVIRFLLLLYYHRRRMHGLVSSLDFSYLFEASIYFPLVKKEGINK